MGAILVKKKKRTPSLWVVCSGGFIKRHQVNGHYQDSYNCWVQTRICYPNQNFKVDRSRWDVGFGPAIQVVGLAPTLQISLQAWQSVNDGFHLVGGWSSNDLEISNKINTQNVVKSHEFLDADPDQTKSSCFSRFVFVFIRKVSVQVLFTNRN